MAARYFCGSKFRPWKLPSSSKRLRRMTSTFSSAGIAALKGPGRPDLWTERIQAGVRIRLTAVRKVLIERADRQLELVVHAIRNPGRRYDVEGKILPLRAEDVRVAVDPAKADTTRDVRLPA